MVSSWALSTEPYRHWERMLKVISLNVNGLRAAVRKNLEVWLEQEQADVVCLQELKAGYKELEPYTQLAGLQAYLHPADRPGYSGVAIYTHLEPMAVHRGFGMPELDHEGRYIQLDFPNFSVASVYLPSGSSSDERQCIKFDCLDVFFPYLKHLCQEKTSMVLCGDWNIAHQNIDLKNWRNNQKNSGFLPEERAWLSRVFDELAWVDVWRYHREDPGYTWWSQRGRAYDNNVGWRIDYHVATPSLATSAQTLRVERTPRFSDHAPIIIDYKFDLKQ